MVFFDFLESLANGDKFLGAAGRSIWVELFCQENELIFAFFDAPRWVTLEYFQVLIVFLSEIIILLLSLLASTEKSD